MRMCCQRWHLCRTGSHLPANFAITIPSHSHHGSYWVYDRDSYQTELVFSLPKKTSSRTWFGRSEMVRPTIFSTRYQSQRAHVLPKLGSLSHALLPANFAITIHSSLGIYITDHLRFCTKPGMRYPTQASIVLNFFLQSGE